MAWTNDLHLSINGFSCINIAAMAVGEILGLLMKEDRDSLLHTLGEILRETTKDFHPRCDTTYELGYVRNLSKNRSQVQNLI